MSAVIETLQTFAILVLIGGLGLSLTLIGLQRRHNAWTRDEEDEE